VSTHIQIRRPRLADLQPIEALLRASGNFSDVEVVTAVEMVQSTLSPPDGDGEASPYGVIVAEKDGQSLGYALFAPTALTKGTWDLYWIAVHPKAHGTGVGKALLRAVEAAVRQAGGRLLVIETSGRADYEKARRLYERGGYTRAATLVDFYKEGDDKLIYTRRVDKDLPAAPVETSTDSQVAAGSPGRAA
jgi:ribosomal protein S18 acetylase RimI-like enzyme